MQGDPSVGLTLKSLFLFNHNGSLTHAFVLELSVYQRPVSYEAGFVSTALYLV